MIFYYPDGDGGRREVDLLPTAAETVKGAIMVGGGLSMDGNTLSAITYDLPVAGTSTLGGIKVGQGLAMSGDTLNCTAYSITYIASDPTGSVSFPNDPLPGAIAFDGDGGYIFDGIDWQPFTNNLSDVPAASVPIASSSQVGGIKVGDGLDVSNNGVLSATPYQLPVAGESTLGGIKVGIGLYMNQDSLQATSNMFFAGEFNDSLFPDWAQRGCVVVSDKKFFLFDGEHWFPFCDCPERTPLMVIGAVSTIDDLRSHSDHRIHYSSIHLTFYSEELKKSGRVEISPEDGYSVVDHGEPFATRVGDIVEVDWTGDDNAEYAGFYLRLELDNEPFWLRIGPTPFDPTTPIRPTLPNYSSTVEGAMWIEG